MYSYNIIIMTNNYIYLLIEREFIALNKPIYKIGRTKQDLNKRIESYPKGSRLLLQMYCCNDCIEIEAKLLRWFRIKYKSHKEIGAEYFEGDYRLMIADIYDVCYKTLDEFNKKVELEYILEDDSDGDISVMDDHEHEVELGFDDKLTLINNMLHKLGLSHPHEIDSIVPIEYIARFEVYYQQVKEKYITTFDCLCSSNNIIDVINKLLRLCGNTQLSKMTKNKYVIIDIENMFQAVNLSSDWLKEIQIFRYNKLT